VQAHGGGHGCTKYEVVADYQQIIRPAEWGQGLSDKLSLYTLPAMPYTALCMPLIMFLSSLLPL
jgi:hypothetical protein